MAKKRRRHPQPPLGPRGQSVEEIIERAGALLEAERYEEALQVLDKAPSHIQRATEVLILRGVILTALERLEEALPVLEEVHQRVPDHPVAAGLLGEIYFSEDMFAHALRTLRPVLPQIEALPELSVAIEAHATVVDAEKEVQYWANTLRIPEKEMEEAMYQVERAVRFAEAGDLLRAIQTVRRAAKLAPGWTVPGEMEVEMLLSVGQLPEATRRAEQLYARYPDHPVIMLLLARCSIAEGNRERARDLARPLRSIRLPNPAALGEAIRVFGLLEDDQALYDLYQKHKRMLSELESTLFFVALGSAAANLGDFRTAQRLWKRVQEEGVSPEWLESFVHAAQEGAPGPGIADRYPTAFYEWLIPQPLQRRLYELISKWENEEITEERFQKSLRSLVAQAPRLFDLIIQTLRTRDFLAGATLLYHLGTPEAKEELRRFAFGQRGDFSDRVLAVNMLADAGEVDIAEPVELWSESLGEWRSYLIPIRRWKEAPPPSRHPKVMALLEQALQALQRQRTDRAIKVMEEAIAIEPDNPELYQRVGLIYQSKGDLDTADQYFYRALEVDPHFTIALSSLAINATKRKDSAAARRFLEAVAREFAKKEVPTVDEYALFLYALGVLALHEKDLDYAYLCAEDGLETEIYGTLFFNLELEIGREKFVSQRKMARRQRRQQEEEKRRQPIPADASLAECLNRVTKDYLIGAARQLRLPYNARKNVLIQRLAGALTDPVRLKEGILTELSAQEKQALRDILNAGGRLPWDDFVARYGDDLEEDAYWKPPETVMGRLRMFGLISDGTVDGEFVVLIPRELRSLLPSLLAEG